MKKSLKDKFYDLKGLTILDENYEEDVNLKLNCIDSDGYKYCISWESLRHSHETKKFISTNPHTICNIKLWLNKNDIGYELLSDKYINNTSKLQFKCCNNHIFDVSWSQFYNTGSRCPICNIENRKYIKNNFKNIKDDLYKEYGYKIISGEYKDRKSMFDIIDDYGYKYYATIESIKIGIKKISSKNPYSIDNIKLWLKLNNKPFILLSDTYINNSSKLKFMCLDNNHIVYMSWADMRTSKVCPKCYHRYEGYDGFIKCLKEDFGDEYDMIGEWNGSGNKTTFIHNKCGTKFMKSPNSFMQGHRCNNNKCCHASGENHYRWNPNLTYEDRVKERKSEKGYVTFIKSVLKRDNYYCQCCHTRSNLVVHHKDGYNWCIERRIDISNGITLCENCHKNFHKIYRYGNNTEKQWNEYINNIKESA